MSAAMLAACGGGGGNTCCTPTGPTAAPTPTPTPSPTPTPAFGNRPAAVGDAFSYAGSMTVTYVRPPLPAGDITPVPNPTNSQTTTTAVAQTIAVSEVSSFNGVASPFDFHTVETDTVNGGLATTTTASDNYFHYLTSGATTDVLFLGSAATDSGGDTFGTTVGAGNGLIDVIPEAAGPIAPANNAALTTTELDASGASLGRTTAADGTYTETGYQLAADPTDTAISATLNADGSGSYTAPLIEPEDVTYAVGAPVPNSSGTPVIPLTLTIPADLAGNPSPGATPDVVVEDPIPVWYPLPLVISQQSLSDTGHVALPAACNVPAAISKAANQTVQATTTIDPVFGEIDVNTTTSYAEDNVGVACLTLSDVVTQYYDLSGQAQNGLLSFGSTPMQTTTTTETLGLTAATVKGAAARQRSAALLARASTAQFRAVLSKHRAVRRAAFYRALSAHLRKGVHR